MCGIAGIFNRKPYHHKDLLKTMIKQVSHRGPDGFGFYFNDTVGLAHARLSIIDLESGWQPIHNEDKTVWVIFNGEIFNYVELREELVKKGHVFYTNSDTEVIVHLYEDEGINMVNKLNGQFAIALYDRKSDVSFLIRDRVGIHPLHYTLQDKSLYFASEIKSLLVCSTISPSINISALSELFTYWAPLPPSTIFEGINEVPEGYYIKFKNGTISAHRYWDHKYKIDWFRDESTMVEEFNSILYDAIKIRLRSDVPVGAYLSGGLDSSTIVAYIQNYFKNDLRTFSVEFIDNEFNESNYQKLITEKYKNKHTAFVCNDTDIIDNFRKLIWHTEKPVIRTAPTPLMILSRQVREHGYKVVLTGEGADEALAGYDIFRENYARRLIKNYPEKTTEILSQLYPWKKDIASNIAFLQAFFGEYDENLPYSSHIPRWNTTNRIKRFMLVDHPQHYNLDMSGITDPLNKAQYLEYHTLLSGYLLSSQGDRVLMANSVEGRYPFLDHRLIEFCNDLPIRMKLRDMNEKFILKETTKGIVPDSIRNRKKQPYMAPDAKTFINDEETERLFSENYGYFNITKIQALLRKAKAGKIRGFSDNMAFIGILSTHILHELFIKDFHFDFSEIPHDKINLDVHQ